MNDKLSFSVREQDKFDLRIASDQRGEQTVNKDCNTIRDKTNFVSNESAVGKWCNKCKQARKTGELYRGVGRFV